MFDLQIFIFTVDNIVDRTSFFTRNKTNFKLVKLFCVFPKILALNHKKTATYLFNAPPRTRIIDKFFVVVVYFILWRNNHSFMYRAATQ